MSEFELSCALPPGPHCLSDLHQLWTTRTAIKKVLLVLHGRHFRYATFSSRRTT